MPVEGIDSFVGMTLNWIVGRGRSGLSAAGAALGVASHGGDGGEPTRRSR